MNCKTCLVLLSLMALSIITGCGDDGGSAVVTQRPSITQTSPQNGAVNTNLNPRIQVWFDQALNETTIDSASFHVTGAESHRVEYVDSLKVIYLYLKNLLEPESAYTVTVTTDIESTKDRSMLADFTFGFTTGPLDCDHLDDYMEPNADMDSAAELDTDKTYPILGSCGLNGYDHFKFTLTEAAKVNLLVRHSYSELEETGWLVRFNKCGGEYYTSVYTRIRQGGALNLQYSFLPGTYCVETGNTEVGVRLAAYDLTLETSAPCPDDAYEDNDFIEESRSITPGTHRLSACYTDSDYFKIDLEAGQTLTARVSRVPAGSQQRLVRIADSEGETLRQSTGPGDPMAVSWTVAQAGTYHIEIIWWDQTEYDLEVEISD